MKTFLIFTFFLLFDLGFGQNKELIETDKYNVERIITAFKNKNIKEISSFFEYPLYRDYPIPKIKNQKEFISRFEQIFDNNLIQKITTSKIEDWNEIGWRGIALKNGIIWINSEGKIFAINYQTNFEEKLKYNLIKEDKKNIYSSLKDFENPTYKIKTEKYRIRIDELKNGKYRYTSWKSSKSESSKPDLILNNGLLEFQGSGGNHVIIFKNNDYTYKIFRNIIRTENDSDISLIIEKNNNEVLNENGDLIIN
ncbi:hypothetical protein [Soonwooa purpurea]